MSVIARFEVIPVREGSMSNAIANALEVLEQFPVSYQTTATDTVIEADSVDQVFEAVAAAHKAIPNGRVITSVEVDEDRRREQTMTERVTAVERRLGRPARRERPTPQRASVQTAGQSRQSQWQTGQQVPAQQSGGQQSMPGQPVQSYQ